VKETLELAVPELDCADEAQQIQAALNRLPGVEEVKTAVGARKAVIAYHPDRIQPDAIREAIRGLGMTIADTSGPDSGRRRSLPELLGWGFVSVVALVALVGIVGERLGLAEALIDRIPWWLALAAVLAGGTRSSATWCGPSGTGA
jgi:cation transport ATPase